MKLQLIRHATLLLTYAGKKILIDPMFSQKGTLPPVDNSANSILNPMVELPLSIDSLLGIDAIMVTHLHPDHFDDAAIEVLPKHLPFFCQPPDQTAIRNWGFENVIPISEFETWKDIKFIRTDGQHGHGRMAEKLGPVSGFILQSKEEASLYIVGDSVWCEEVAHSIQKYEPDYVVINSGEAQFLEGGPITMGITDLKHMLDFSSKINIIAVHFETWNHCFLKRDDMREFLKNKRDAKRVWIPEDGETLGFA